MTDQQFHGQTPQVQILTTLDNSSSSNNTATSGNIIAPSRNTVSKMPLLSNSSLENNPITNDSIDLTGNTNNKTVRNLTSNNNVGVMAVPALNNNINFNFVGANNTQFNSSNMVGNTNKNASISVTGANAASSNGNKSNLTNLNTLLSTESESSVSNNIINPNVTNPNSGITVTSITTVKPKPKSKLPAIQPIIVPLPFVNAQAKLSSTNNLNSSSNLSKDMTTMSQAKYNSTTVDTSGSTAYAVGNANLNSSGLWYQLLILYFVFLIFCLCYFPSSCTVF